MNYSIQDTKQVYERIRSKVRNTPLLRSDYLSNKYNRNIFVKLENLQHTNSFKLRGACSKILDSVEKNPNIKGFVTASGGNHGLGVGLL